MKAAFGTVVEFNGTSEAVFGTSEAVFDVTVSPPFDGTVAALAGCSGSVHDSKLRSISPSYQLFPSASPPPPVVHN